MARGISEAADILTALGILPTAGGEVMRRPAPLRALPSRPALLGALWLPALLLLACAPAVTQGPGALPEGTSVLRLEVGPPGAPLCMRVHAYRPPGVGLDAPVLLVVHGRSRNAAGYLRRLREAAGRHGVLLFAPEFTADAFPGFQGFNMGGLFDRNGARRPAAESAFAVPGRVFARLRARYGVRAETFDLYGHSAGAQFVHRMVLFGQVDPRARRIVAANAGTYTFPDEAAPLPFGTGGAGLTAGDYARAFALPLDILVGGRDNDPAHPLLSRRPGALRQGAHRLARARGFFTQARHKAAELGVPFRWRLRVVPGVAHNGRRMGEAALALWAQDGPAGARTAGPPPAP